jgi:hypothetical protein
MSSVTPPCKLLGGLVEEVFDVILILLGISLTARDQPHFKFIQKTGR